MDGQHVRKVNCYIAAARTGLYGTSHVDGSLNWVRKEVRDVMVDWTCSWGLGNGCSCVVV